MTLHLPTIAVIGLLLYFSIAIGFSLVTVMLRDQLVPRLWAASLWAAALNTAGLPGRNRVGIGVGMQGGQSAVAVGYQFLVRPNVSVSLSGAFSSGESSVSAGTGFSW